MRTKVDVDPAPIGVRVRRAREEIGVSQEVLAKAIGVGRGQIAHIETGRSWPSAWTLRCLAIALGVSADYLLVIDRRKK